MSEEKKPLVEVQMHVHSRTEFAEDYEIIFDEDPGLPILEIGPNRGRYFKLKVERTLAGHFAPGAVFTVSFQPKREGGRG